MIHINLEAEKVILGTIIVRDFFIETVSDILQEKHFADKDNGKIYNYILENNLKIRLDFITLRNFFQDNVKNGLEYLGELMKLASSLGIRDYALLLIELWQKREFEQFCKDSLENLKSRTFDIVSSELEEFTLGLKLQDTRKKTYSINEVLKDVESPKEINKTIPTKFYNLDKFLDGGFQTKQLIILGARPSVGKTTFAQNVIFNVVKAGYKCLFISLEVDRLNVMYKFLSNACSLPSWKIKTKTGLSKDDIERINSWQKEFSKYSLYINDSSSLTIKQIEKIIKNQIARNPIDFVVIDYVQIIHSDNYKNKNEALIIKEHTTALKSFAKTYDISVFALAQISRKGVDGKNEPTINDFKGSGGIEEDADVALILHRDRDEEKKENYLSASGKITVAKNRHGRTGEIGIKYDGVFNRFMELGGFE